MLKDLLLCWGEGKQDKNNKERGFSFRPLYLVLLHCWRKVELERGGIDMGLLLSPDDICQLRTTTLLNIEEPHFQGRQGRFSNHALCSD